MTNYLEQLSIRSEFGDIDLPSMIKIKMNGSHHECPVTFYDDDGKPFFSMGNDEIHEFCEQLSKFIL